MLVLNYFKDAKCVVVVLVWLKIIFLDDYSGLCRITPDISGSVGMTGEVSGNNSRCVRDLRGYYNYHRQSVSSGYSWCSFIEMDIAVSD
jgi:hypothetical protein